MSSIEAEGYWKCCQEGLDPFSELPCDKNNPLEVSTCQRCGHWICDSCPKTESKGKGKAPVKLVLAVELKSNPPPEPSTVARSMSTIKRMASTRLRRERDGSNSPVTPAFPATPEKGDEADGDGQATMREGNLVRRMSSIKRMASTLRKENAKPLETSSPEKLQGGEDELTPKPPKEGKMARRMISVKRMTPMKLGSSEKRRSGEVTKSINSVSDVVVELKDEK